MAEPVRRTGTPGGAGCDRPAIVRLGGNGYGEALRSQLRGGATMRYGCRHAKREAASRLLLASSALRAAPPSGLSVRAEGAVCPESRLIYDPLGQRGFGWTLGNTAQGCEGTPWLTSAIAVSESGRRVDERWGGGYPDFPRLLSPGKVQKTRRPPPNEKQHGLRIVTAEAAMTTADCAPQLAESPLVWALGDHAPGRGGCQRGSSSPPATSGRIAGQGPRSH